MKSFAAETVVDRTAVTVEQKNYPDQCTACTTCGDRDTCECTLTEVLNDEQPTE